MKSRGRTLAMIADKCNLGYSEQNEWYFFSHKDRKYPTGTRTNRATAAGFWKATGRDKAVLSKNVMIGMRKTLVFYKGRAPNGRKSDWIMHEYRLQTTEHAPPQEEGWVVCRAFKKPSPSHKQGFDAWNHHYNNYYLRNNNYSNSSNNIIDSPTEMTDSITTQANTFHPQQLGQPFGNFEQEYTSNPVNLIDNQLIDLPRLDSPSLSTSFAPKDDHMTDSGRKWEILEDLFSNPTNSQLVPNEYDQLNSFLGCFPNL
ncbi:hypothetical protein RND81_01G213700 [Saponaria officinalis]|uniref:NAC domain-containing protein n=1 Tax=Saponaria officinalis TaxID=3572 RepID=A0AAW1NHV1_SAPOF